MIKVNETQCVEKKNRWYYLHECIRDEIVSSHTIKKSEYDRAIRRGIFISDKEMTISDKIFDIMAEKNIKQLDLSKATKISQSVIADWKRLRTNPAANKILAICECLDVTPEELLRGAK